MAREQIKRVGQNGQGSAEGANRSGGAAGKVEDEAGAQGAAEAAAQNRHGSLTAALAAHQFRNAVEEAFADGTGGLGGDIATADAGASGGDDEAGGGSGAAQCVLNGRCFVWYGKPERDRKTTCLQLADDGGTGQVLTRSLGTGVAYGNDGSGFAGCLNGVFRRQDTR